MQLLLHTYFTNAGSCWWVHFTGMQHFLGPYFTIAMWETQPIWDNLTTLFDLALSDCYLWVIYCLQIRDLCLAQIVAVPPTDTVLQYTL
jgi:hypothetical protein